MRHLSELKKYLLSNTNNDEDCAWVEAPMTVTQMRRSLQSHKQWFNNFGQQLEGHADLYAGTSLNAASAAMQETMVKFRVKCAFLEKAYRQFIRLDPTREAEYKFENKALLTQLSHVLDCCNKATLVQKKSASIAAKNDDDKRGKTLRA